MIRLSTVLALVTLLAVPACSQASSPGTDSTASSSAAVHLTYGDLVGTWRFVYTDEVRAAHATLLASKISDPKQLEEAKKEAAAEAATSQIEFTPDRRYLSRIYGRIILEDRFTVRDGADSKTLELRSVEHPTGALAVVMRDADTIVLSDPKKGELVFTRLR